MGIAQGSTPYLMLTILDFDLTDAAVVVALKSIKTLLELSNDRVTVTSDGTDSLVTVHLTQAETLMLQPGTATVQVRWRDAQGEAHTTEKAQVSVADAIYKGVI